MSENNKNRRKAPSILIRKPGEPIQPYVSRPNPVADMIFGSVTPEMVAEAGQREKDFISDQEIIPQAAPLPITDTSDKPSFLSPAHTTPPHLPSFEETSTKATSQSTPVDFTGPTPVESTGPTPVNFTGPTPVDFTGLTPVKSTGLMRGFLAIPHELLDRIFAEITHYSAFKVYLFLYRAAFRRVHDNRVNNRCDIALPQITRQCGIPDKVVRDAIKVLSEKGWITVESRPGTPNSYIVNRLFSKNSGEPQTPVDSTGHDKESHDDLKKEKSSSKKASKNKKTAQKTKNLMMDDDLIFIIEAYEQITHNAWTPKDTDEFKKIEPPISKEELIDYIRVIHERTASPIGSFAYFVKAIKREKEQPNTKASALKKLRKIAESIRNAHVGDPNYTQTDFREDVKTRAAQENVTYAPDLLNQVIDG